MRVFYYLSFSEVQAVEDGGETIEGVSHQEVEVDVQLGSLGYILVAEKCTGQQPEGPASVQPGG